VIDAESASAFVRTYFTVPVLTVAVVVAGAVLVKRLSARRRRRAWRPGPQPTATAWAQAAVPARGGSSPSVCAEHGHDLVVQHDSKTGLPATVRCATPGCRSTWDAVPDSPPAVRSAQGGQRPATEAGSGRSSSRPGATAPSRGRDTGRS